MQAWPIFIESVQVSVASVRFMANHRAAVEARVDMSSVYEQMEKLDRWVVLATAKAEAHLPVPFTEVLDPTQELVMTQVMRRLSRIRLSR